MDVTNELPVQGMNHTAIVGSWTDNKFHVGKLFVSGFVQHYRQGPRNPEVTVAVHDVLSPSTVQVARRRPIHIKGSFILKTVARIDVNIGDHTPTKRVRLSIVLADLKGTKQDGLR